MSGALRLVKCRLLATAVAALFLANQAVADVAKPKEITDKAGAKDSNGGDLIGASTGYKHRRITKASSLEVDTPMEPVGYQHQGTYERPGYVKGYAKLRDATYGKISYSRDDSYRQEQDYESPSLHERVNYGKVKYSHGGDEAAGYRESDDSRPGTAVDDGNTYSNDGYLTPIYNRGDYVRVSHPRGTYRHKSRPHGMSYMPVEYNREVYPYEQGDQQAGGQVGYSSRLHNNKIGGSSSVFDGGSYNYADANRYQGVGGDYDFGSNKPHLQPGSSIQGGLSIFGGYGQGNGNLRYRDFVPYYGSDGYYSRHDNGGYGLQSYGSSVREGQPKPYEEYSNALNEGGYDEAYAGQSRRYGTKVSSGKKTHKQNGSNRSGLGAYIVGVEYIGRTPLLVQTQPPRSAPAKEEQYWK
ncbi:uncharacterized protein LOC119436319 [Dermacentor silvarum]|uniref:uncharacterized protein LOC119436319 n=1 Tax=Dermacentor silvarum TaxID=543639 RepID=UPI001897A95A|nr:uncharacterized protein LOC119436319 [Dermacentor silvarum]